MLRFRWLTGELFDRISDNKIFDVNNYRKGSFMFFKLNIRIEISRTLLIAVIYR